ncbi:Prolyl 3-hydroxylase ogfod1, partial [Dermatophagoides pteronyssinus]
STELKSEHSTTIINKPFKVVQFHNFIENDQLILPQILHAANTIPLQRRSNDLYSLQQSRDLKNYPSLKNIVEFFQIKVKSFLENLTGLQLNNNVALTFSKYEQNDYLLCHDDQLEQRKIAFILYLVDEQWSDVDGGQLELFATESTPSSSKDEQQYDQQPSEIAARLIPKSNTLAFFEVNRSSFHQVGEILTDRSPRWSLNGWFHSDDVIVGEQHFLYPQLPTFPESEILEDDLTEHFPQWINPIFLQNFIQKQIRLSFKRNSEIQLKNFLNEDKYEQIQSALSSESVRKLWHKNYRPLFFRNHIIRHDEDFQKLPDILKEFYLLINSKNFYKLITTMTGVTFVDKRKSSKNQNGNANNNNDDEDVQLIKEQPSTSSSSSSTTATTTSETKTKFDYKTRGAIIEWDHGDYSLSSDINPDINERALDLDFFFNVPRLQAKSTKKFGDQEIIDISDDDDNGKSEDDDEKPVTTKENKSDNAKESNNPTNKPKEEEKQNENESKSEANKISIKEPELIELDSEDDDDIEFDEENEDDEDEDEDNEDDEEYDDEDEMDDHYRHLHGGDDNHHSTTTTAKGGGYIAYITDDSDEQVLEIEPNNNVLNIVYRNYQCQRFMKYIDHSNLRTPFQHISIIFTDQN